MKITLGRISLQVAIASADPCQNDCVSTDDRTDLDLRLLTLHETERREDMWLKNQILNGVPRW